MTAAASRADAQPGTEQARRLASTTSEVPRLVAISAGRVLDFGGRERERWLPWLETLTEHGIALQLREASVAPDAHLALVSWVRRNLGGSLFLNLGDAELELTLQVASHEGLDGVHLPSRRAESLTPAGLDSFLRLHPGLLISRACHSAEEAVGAGRAGFHYVTLSPIYPTASKPGSAALGPAALHRAGDLPVLALGGVDPERLPKVLSNGAWGAAGIRAFSTAGGCRAMRQALGVQ